MTTHRQYEGERIDTSEHELKTYYEKDGEQIPKDELSFIFECDLCGEFKEFSKVFGMKPSKHICKECLSDDVVEALEDNN